MVRRRLDMLAAAAALSLTAAAPAAAGGCCPAPYSNCPCAPLAVAEPFVAPSGIYVVNLGPVYSGPGPYLPREPSVNPLALSGGYPYVGSVYTGYPYGLQNAGGYPRGSYSPYTGYPYAEPLGYPVVKRVSYRPARVYHRGPRVMRMPGK
jgi:hypothetical protein